MPTLYCCEPIAIQISLLLDNEQKSLKMNKYICLLFCIALSIVSCREDNIVPIDNTPEEPIVETMYQQTVYGSVVGPDEEPIVNALLEAQGRTTQTNEFGLFEMTAIDVSDVKGAYITVKMDGFFDTGFRIYTSNISTQKVNVEMVPKVIVTTINGRDGGEATLDNGTKIEFAPGSIAKDGATHEGLVNIYAYYLDPSVSDFMDRSPGDLSGVRTDQTAVLLNSFGMIAVELESSTGEALNVAPGQLADITVPVPSTLLSDAPSTIPLWHFDDNIQRWVEEGEATLEGGVYVGKVSHFSWWNCDDFSNPINLCVNIDQSNIVFEDVDVILCSQNFGTSSGTTDETGTVCGLVPAGEVITLKIYDVCGNVIYTEQIGPFSTSPQQITINANLAGNSYAYTFNGQLLGCAGTGGVIPNAFVRIEAGNVPFFTTTDVNGNYDVSKILCDPTIDYTVVGIDPVSNSSGSASSTADFNVVNTLDILMCDTGNQFVQISDGSGTNLFTSDTCTVKFKANENIIVSEQSFIAGYSGVGAGTFPLNIQIGNISCGGPDCEVTITNSGPVNGFVSGTISGTNFDGSTFTGIFSALRTE